MIDIPAVSYIEGDDNLRLDDGKIRVTFENDTHVDIDMTNPLVTFEFDFSQAGEKTIKVKYAGFETSYDVVVRQLPDLSVLGEAIDGAINSQTNPSLFLYYYFKALDETTAILSNWEGWGDYISENFWEEIAQLDLHFENTFASYPEIIQDEVMNEFVRYYAWCVYMWETNESWYYWGGHATYQDDVALLLAKYMELNDKNRQPLLEGISNFAYYFIDSILADFSYKWFGFNGTAFVSLLRSDLYYYTWIYTDNEAQFDKLCQYVNALEDAYLKLSDTHKTTFDTNFGEWHTSLLALYSSSFSVDWVQVDSLFKKAASAIEAVQYFGDDSNYLGVWFILEAQQKYILASQNAEFIEKWNTEYAQKYQIYVDFTNTQFYDYCPALFTDPVLNAFLRAYCDMIYKWESPTEQSYKDDAVALMAMYDDLSATQKREFFTWVQDAFVYYTQYLTRRYYAQFMTLEESFVYQNLRKAEIYYSIYLIGEGHEQYLDGFIECMKLCVSGYRALVTTSGFDELLGEEFDYYSEILKEYYQFGPQGYNWDIIATLIYNLNVCYNNNNDDILFLGIYFKLEDAVSLIENSGNEDWISWLNNKFLTDIESARALYNSFCSSNEGLFEDDDLKDLMLRLSSMAYLLEFDSGYNPTTVMFGTDILQIMDICDALSADQLNKIINLKRIHYYVANSYANYFIYKMEYTLDEANVVYYLVQADMHYRIYQQNESTERYNSFLAAIKAAASYYSGAGSTAAFDSYNKLVLCFEEYIGIYKAILDCPEGFDWFYLDSLVSRLSGAQSDDLQWFYYFIKLSDALQIISEENNEDWNAYYANYSTSIASIQSTFVNKYYLNYPALIDDEVLYAFLRELTLNVYKWNEETDWYSVNAEFIAAIGQLNEDYYKLTNMNKAALLSLNSFSYYFTNMVFEYYSASIQYATAVAWIPLAMGDMYGSAYLATSNPDYYVEFAKYVQNATSRYNSLSGTLYETEYNTHFLELYQDLLALFDEAKAIYDENNKKELGDYIDLLKNGANSSMWLYHYYEFQAMMLNADQETVEYINQAYETEMAAIDAFFGDNFADFDAALNESEELNEFTTHYLNCLYLWETDPNYYSYGEHPTYESDIESLVALYCKLSATEKALLLGIGDFKTSFVAIAGDYSGMLSYNPYFAYMLMPALLNADLYYSAWTANNEDTNSYDKFISNMASVLNYYNNLSENDKAVLSASFGTIYDLLLGIYNSATQS